MKKLAIVITGLMLSFLLTSNAFSQGKAFIHFEPSFPMADFADEEEAAVGLGLGFNYIYPLFESGLGLYCGIDFSYNGIQDDLKKEIEEKSGIDDDDITYYKFLNFPVSAGLNYTLKTDSNIGLILNAGLAANFLKVTDLVFETSEGDATLKYDLGSGIGYKISGGILINDKTSIEISYLGLGEYDLEGEGEAPGGSVQEIESETKIDILKLSLGFKLE